MTTLTFEDILSKGLDLQTAAKIRDISSAFIDEYIHARKELQHKPMNSTHEGYAIILEELDELWDLIKLKNPDKQLMKEEATQIGAMTLAFILEVCEE